MSVRINPKIEPVDTESQHYPLVFRMSRYHYVIAAFTIAVSLFLIGASFYQEEQEVVLLLIALGVLFLGLSVMYIVQIKNNFVKLDKDTMRYREYRRIITFDLNQIYVELMEGAFLLYSPQHPRISIGSQYKNSTLLHSILYKHSEENTSRENGTPHEDFTGFKSFTGKVSGTNKRRQRLNDILLVLLFIGVNIISYLKAPERDFTYHFLVFILTGTSYGVALYTGRRKAAKSRGR